MNNTILNFIVYKLFAFYFITNANKKIITKLQTNIISPNNLLQLVYPKK